MHKKHAWLKYIIMEEMFLSGKVHLYIIHGLKDNNTKLYIMMYIYSDMYRNMIYHSLSIILHFIFSNEKNK